MSAVCPGCGVAVVPGYVKCPKCHSALPLVAARRARPTGDPGGTAMKEAGFPIAAILVPVAVVLAFVVIFGLRGGGDDDPTEVPEVDQIQPNQVAAPHPVAQPQPQPQTREAVTPLAQPPPGATAVADLERALRKQRLWTTIEVNDGRIDVRTSSCSDAALAPILDAAVASLREAGLTRLRCLAQSGSVVFERGL
ncbi:MAG: hypothetical protein ABI867_34925 [Kofleriaceae bacterium]